MILCMNNYEWLLDLRFQWKQLKDCPLYEKSTIENKNVCVKRITTHLIFILYARKKKKKHDLTLENEFNFHRNGEHVCVCDNGNHNGGTLKVENMC